jgi:hypothetical protein
MGRSVPTNAEGPDTKAPVASTLPSHHECRVQHTVQRKRCCRGRDGLVCNVPREPHGRSARGRGRSPGRSAALAAAVAAFNDAPRAKRARADSASAIAAATAASDSDSDDDEEDDDPPELPTKRKRPARKARPGTPTPAAAEHTEADNIMAPLLKALQQLEDVSQLHHHRRLVSRTACRQCSARCLRHVHLGMRNSVY